MMRKTKKTITFSRKTWEEMRANELFRELIEIIEDKEAILKEEQTNEPLMDYEEFRKKRIA